MRGLFICSILICFLIINSCKVLHLESKSRKLSNIEDNHLCCAFEIKVLDISEDATRLSTLNDELVVLIYSDSLNSSTRKLLAKEYFVFDSIGSIKVLDANINLNSYTSVLFILIELDTRQSVDEIEKIISPKVNSRNILSVEVLKTNITKVIGDNDLLGLYKFNKADLHKKEIVFEFKGNHLFDTYSYSIIGRAKN